MRKISIDCSCGTLEYKPPEILNVLPVDVAEAMANLAEELLHDVTNSLLVGASGPEQMMKVALAYAECIKVLRANKSFFDPTRN